jgi:hypothetical protein
MDSFDNLLKVAAHIKSYQLNQDKRKFDNLPEFYKTGLYYNDMFKDIRDLPFESKKEIYNKNKEEALVCLKEQKYEDAMFSFCKCLCVFKYIKTSVVEWKKEAIKDEDLTYIDASGENAEEDTEITNMKISTLLNIALCALAQENFVEARQACDEVIQLNPNNIKA